MSQEIMITFFASLSSLAVSLLTAVVGLIVTALKYKKQKYEIAMLEQENKLVEASGHLSAEEITEVKAVLKGLKKEKC